jgi:hypothetical protein
MSAFHIFQAKEKLPVIPLTCLILLIITSCNKYENDDNFMDLRGMQGRESSIMGSEIIYGPENLQLFPKNMLMRQGLLDQLKFNIMKILFSLFRMETAARLKLQSSRFL